MSEHRYLSTHQVQAFCFRGHHSEVTAARAARRVLARLRRDGLLGTLERRIGGVRSGSAATVWQLTDAGNRLLYGERRRRATQPSERFLSHTLAVADVHVLLRQIEGREGIEEVAVQVEPASWRRYQGAAGEPRWLQPDLYAEITTREFIDRAFIEVDMGTESLPTLLGKCEQFEFYRRSGVEQARRGNVPLVIWLLHSEARARQLEKAIERSGKLSRPMYRFATPHTLAQVLLEGAA